MALFIHFLIGGLKQLCEDSKADSQHCSKLHMRNWGSGWRMTLPLNLQQKPVHKYQYSLKISASTFTCCISERNLGFVSEDLATSVKVVVFLLGWTLVTTTCGRCLLQLGAAFEGEHWETRGTYTRNNQRTQDFPVWRKEDRARCSWHLQMFYGLPGGRRIRFVLCNFRQQK